MPGPNAACVLVIAGILGIYLECIRPGRVLPGVVGAAVLILGAYSLDRLSPQPLGLALLAISVALFAAEAIWDSYLLFGICAAAALAAGFRLLFEEPPRISLLLAIAAAAVLGAANIFLASAAKRARRNKRADVEE
jgi:membrane-bound serine protease (ClpP class)